MYNQAEVCEVCGYPGYLDRLDTHHIYRRSTHKHLIDDPRNHLRLCRKCHQKATDSQEFERFLQRKFYPNPT